MKLFAVILGYTLFLAISLFVVFFLPVFIWVQRRNKKRDASELKKKVDEAIEQIMADGKVEGPKGSYVPHRRRGPMTDGSTKSPKHSGYYHQPWQ